MNKAVAIVGMGARFAGASDLTAYWKMCRDGRDGFGPVPPDRWDAARFTDKNPRIADKSYAPAGAFIDDIRSFPALALSIPPRRVEVMDPQQRFAIESALWAIEDAGKTPATVARRTGVFMGVTSLEYRMLMGSRVIAAMMASGQFGEAPVDPTALAEAVENVVPPRPLSAPGTLGNMVAAAISQELDLTGPAFTVDAACASALIAVHEAMVHLREGSIDAALAGGVFVSMTPEHHIVFSRIGAMSQSGVCRPFDSRADGFVEGDGVGMVLLKRLADAQRDGDRIYAVIEGVASNNDGRGDGPMAPLETGQAAAISEAWADAGIDPARARYVETHGTGTAVGDPTEIRGLTRALGDRATEIRLGSSKANVGHTMSAAGVAGLIRTALALHHREIPPMAGFATAREDLALETTPFSVPTSVEAWDTDDRVAGVSSFGFGGTNAHVVMTGKERMRPKRRVHALGGNGKHAPHANGKNGTNGTHAPSNGQRLWQRVTPSAVPDLETLRTMAKRTAEAMTHAPVATVTGAAKKVLAKRPRWRSAGAGADGLALRSTPETELGEPPVAPPPPELVDEIATLPEWARSETRPRYAFPDDAAELVLMCAPDEAALRDLAARTADAIAISPTATLSGVARAFAGRRLQPARLGVVATSLPDLREKLAAIGAGETPAGARIGIAPETAPKLAFLYPGQGSQRLGMIAGIRDRFPLVSRTLDALETELDGELGVPLTHLLYPERREKAVDDETAMRELTSTEHCQPALLSVGVALTRLLDQVGVRPDVVTGHSLGEFTAAAAASVVGPVEAARFVARRGRAMAKLPGDHGAMAAIMAGADEAEKLLVDGAVIANRNHPRQVVVSGTTGAIEKVIARAKEASVKAVRLEVSHAFHSPVLEGLDAEALLEDMRFGVPAVPVASAISGSLYAGADDARAVFLRHAISPVDFERALGACRDAGAEVFLQVGAGGPLAAFARGALPRGTKVLSLAGTDDTDGGASLLETLGALFVLGVPVDLSMVIAPGARASVPPTVLPREVYWAVKDAPQPALDLEGATPRPKAEKKAAPEAAAPKQAAAETPAAPAPSDAEGLVLAAVSKASAYPIDAIRPEMRLVDDLGFDSLMVNDLVEALADSVPGLPGIPQELFVNQPTVAMLVDYVKENAGSAAPEETADDAPLAGYRPVWREAALPASTRELPETPTAIVTGDDLAGCEAVAARLTALGAEVFTGPVAEVEGASAGLVVFVKGANEPSVAEVIAGEAEVPDPAEPLVTLLDAQADHPFDLLVAASDGDPWAEALAGAARALSRERPDAMVKALAFDPTIGPTDRADALLAEWRSTDTTVDVRLDGTTRFVRGLEPVDSPAREAKQSGEVVLVTGGTRGIGAKLAARLAGDGATVLLLGRGEPSAEARALLDREGDRVRHLVGDVTDRASLERALDGAPEITTLVHAAGILADGALGEVPADDGRRARAVKAAGFLNAVGAAGPSLRTALAVGSWAGRFGNRHQIHYAAANALVSALSRSLPEGVRGVVAEMGPWTGSEMVQSIPRAVQQAMRAEGVDFVGDTAGLDALANDLASGEGPIVHGRNLPRTLRSTRRTVTLSTKTHPYLLDHAIDGVPVLPLAAATDLLAEAAGASAPFEVQGLTLFAGVTVEKPVTLVAKTNGETAELRFADSHALAYRARIAPAAPVADPGPASGGEAPTLSLREFYDDVTFHGEKLQGIVSIDGVGEGFVRGRVHTGRPAEWIPGTDRTRFTVDPLALDSAMQLSAYVAWTRYGRAGTPVGIDRYVQLRALPEGDLVAEARFGESEGDLFRGDLYLRDGAGTLLAVAEGVSAKLAEAKARYVAKPEHTDPSTWPAVKDLELRLGMAEAAGIKNPYFAVHEGTARNTSIVEGRELVNFSSYNYLGLSGDPRILDEVEEAVRRYGTSVSASRVASGERPFHRALEEGLARAQGAEDALAFTAGHATNMNAIGHLMEEGDLVLHDELIHDSILQGIKLSGAARRGFRHDDPEHLEQQLRDLRAHYEKVLIVVEGVYSMDGDICHLPDYVELKRRFGCLLMVDEAHSFGVVGAHGRGVGEHHGLEGDEVDIWMGTLSKSLASCGGWIAGSKTLVRYLRYTAPGFVYSAGLTPANGQAALSALTYMMAEPERVARLQANAKRFHAALRALGVDTGPALGESGVVPAITGNSMHALLLSQRLLDQGVNVQPIMYPAVADQSARLRFFLSSTHTDEELDETAKKVAETLEGVRKDFPA